MSPEMINFFSYCIKNMSFWGSPKGAPHDRCRRTMKKTYFAMKTNGIRWCSYLKKWIFPLRLIFYVCSSARNWVSAMYKGIDQFPLGSSNPGCLKFLERFNKKNRSPEMINFFLYCIKKISFWGSPKGPPHDRCRRTMKKYCFAMNTNGNR